jgi:glyoxylase-like metal-dependent hydrolase (beta-lactamase superfamily II)
VTYTGTVTVGGNADVRELPGLTISKLAVGPHNNNAYLLRCRATGAQLLVDAAAEPERLLAMIGDDGLLGVVTTHAHADHWGALEAVDIGVRTDETVPDGGTVRVGEVSLTAIHLVGHTPGSIALLYDDPEGPPHLFTGDCLFPGGVGNTWKDPARFASLYDGVVSKLFDRLPDETWVYPGHGDDTTIGDERPHLAEWRSRGW